MGAAKGWVAGAVPPLAAEFDNTEAPCCRSIDCPATRMTSPACMCASAATVTLSASTLIFDPSALSVPPNTSSPTCQLLISDAAIPTVSVGTVCEDPVTSSRVAVISTTAALPAVLDALPSKVPAKFRLEVTATDRRPASAGKLGTGLLAAAAAAKKVDALLTV